MRRPRRSGGESWRGARCTGSGGTRGSRATRSDARRSSRRPPARRRWPPRTHRGDGEHGSVGRANPVRGRGDLSPGGPLERHAGEALQEAARGPRFVKTRGNRSVPAAPRGADRDRELAGRAALRGGGVMPPPWQSCQTERMDFGTGSCSRPVQNGTPTATMAARAGRVGGRRSRRRRRPASRRRPQAGRWPRAGTPHGPVRAGRRHVAVVDRPGRRPCDVARGDVPRGLEGVTSS